MGKSLHNVAISPLSTDSHMELLGHPTRFSHSHAIKDWEITKKWSAGGTWEAADGGEVTWFSARRL